MTMIYKICSATIWQQAETAGFFAGAGIDLADGYIHFSSASQVAETARLHFASQPDLVLVEVDSTAVEIVWEHHAVASCFRIYITNCRCQRLFQLGHLRWYRQHASATASSGVLDKAAEPWRAASRLALVVGESVVGAP